MRNFEELIMAIQETQELSEADKRIIIANIEKFRRQNVNILITGATGCGKSSTINALFNGEVAVVGTGTEPETMEIRKYTLENMTLWDSPGLGDSTQKDLIHANKITELLHQEDENGNALIDLVLVIVDGSTRDIGTVIQLITSVVLPALGKNNANRLLVGINKIDIAKSGRYWDYNNVCPQPQLQQYLDELQLSIKDRIFESTGVSVTPICYSAGYKEPGLPQTQPYNIIRLMDYMMRSISHEKRLIIANNMNNDITVWEKSDDLENYRSNIGESLVSSITTGVNTGMQIGEKIGGFLGEPGRVVGRILGGILGGVGGFVLGIIGF